MTQEPTGGWTSETLLVYLTSLIEAIKTLIVEKDVRYNERHEAAEKAVLTASRSAEKATEKTEAALAEYKVFNNEWRSTLDNALARMPTRLEIDGQFAATDSKIDQHAKATDQRLRALESEIANLRESRSVISGQSTAKQELERRRDFLLGRNWGWVGVAVGTLIALVSLWLRAKR